MRNVNGNGIVEYSLIIALVVIGLIFAFNKLGKVTVDLYSSTNLKLIAAHQNALDNNENEVFVVDNGICPICHNPRCPYRGF